MKSEISVNMSAVTKGVSSGAMQCHQNVIANEMKVRGTKILSNVRVSFAHN